MASGPQPKDGLVETVIFCLMVIAVIGSICCTIQAWTFFSEQ